MGGTSAAVPGGQGAAIHIDTDSYPYLALYAKPLKPAEREIIGRNREMRSIKAALRRPELCNVLLLAEAGSGKALDDRTLIPVCDARGYVPIGGLVPGDFVYGRDGCPVRVDGVFPQGRLRAFRVHFSDGTYEDCNDSHLWALGMDKGCQSGMDVMELGAVIDEQAHSLGAVRWLPPNGALDREGMHYPLHPLAAGALLACGSVKGDLLVLGGGMGREGAGLVASALGAGGVEWDLRHRCWSLLKGKGGCPPQGYCREQDIPGISRFLGPEGERRIPWEYFLGSLGQRDGLLRGIFLAGGDYADLCGAGSVRVGNHGLAEDICMLASSLGLRVYVDGAAGAGYLCRIGDPDVSIVSVEDLHTEAEMTCIHVESKDHLFQAGIFHHVTHNTALVQGTMKHDPGRIYLEVDLAKMTSGVSNEGDIAMRLKSLFDDTERYRKDMGQELVLFIDEFHQIVQLSAPAVEALKPLLADSGTRGIKVIVATTYREFTEYVAPNQALVERLTRINVPEPGKKTVIAILKGMAERYGVGHELYDPNIFECIYDYTNRYIPANAQPRKSIVVLDAMIGWHNAYKIPMGMRLLADVIYESEGVNVAFRVDGQKIRDALNAAVFSQEAAVEAVENRLQIAVSDLHDSTRPMSSFLFAGSSGCGKTELCKTLAKLLFSDERSLLRFDMTEYSMPDSVERFREQLTARVWEHPYSIVLLDEVEKACGEVTRILLQVLDDGRLVNQYDRETSFLNAYIILTTNAGSETFRNIGNYEADDSGSGRRMRGYMKLLRKSLSGQEGNKFPPELLGRIDAVVPFQPLSPSTLIRIARNKLEKLKERVYRKHNVDLAIDLDEVAEYLVLEEADNDPNAGGARNIVRRMDVEVTSVVSRYLNTHSNVRQVGVRIEGVPMYKNKSLRISSAHVAVYPVR